MCAVQDVRNEGLARGGDLPFELVERVMEECSPHQPVVDLIGGEPLLYPLLYDAIKLASGRKVLAVVTTNGLKCGFRAKWGSFGLGPEQCPTFLGMVPHLFRNGAAAVSGAG
jgi:hypothetical protein